MTPSGVRRKTGADASTHADSSCPGPCHQANKKDTNSFSTGKTLDPSLSWFVQGSQVPAAPDRAHARPQGDLADWAQKLTLGEPPVAPQAKGADPKEIIARAKEAEKLGDQSKEINQQISHYENALLNFQWSKDSESAKRVYGKIRKLFADQGNSVGVAKIDAELAFLEGNFSEALKGLQGLETLYLSHPPKISKAERNAFLSELNLKITLTHRAQAAALSKQENWTEALSHMEAALKRSPSPILAGETLALLNKVHDPAQLRKRLKRVETEKFQLDLQENMPCKANCHLPNQDPNDFKFKNYDSLFQTPSGNQDPFGFSQSAFPKPGMKVGLSDADRKMLIAYLQGLDPKAPEPGKSAPTSPTQPAPVTTAADPSAWYWQQNFAPAPPDPTTYQGKKSFLEAEGNQAEADYEAWAKKAAWVVRTGYGNAASGETFVQQELALAQVYQSCGDLTRTQTHLKDLLAMVPHDPKKPEVILQRTTISHQLAMVQLTLGNDTERRVKNPGLLKEAVENLDRSYAELKALRQNSGVRFLLNQNRFLRCEILMAQSNSLEDVKEVQSELKDILSETPLRLLPQGDPNRILLGRVKLRLAQLTYGLPDEKAAGHGLVAEILREFPDDSFLGSQAMVAQGMAYLSTEGKSLEGLRVLREMQIKFPGSDGDKMVRSAKNLQNLLGPDGILKENIHEEDFGEALKVALDKAVNTGPRKLGFIAMGFAIVLILVPEPSTTALGLGMLGGLAVDMGIGVAEGWGDIMDSYRSGISTVDTTRNLQNIFLLALDVALLVPAGAAGSLVRTGTEVGLSRVAVGTSEFLSRSAMGTLTARALLPVGQFTYRWLPRVAESTAAYTFYQAERSLVFGTEFHWDPGEAALMFGMMQSFAMAGQLGYGSRLATAGKFQRGNLKPVFQEGKLIGFSNPAGRLAGWATDTVIGATGFYGLMVGLDRAGISQEPLPNYWDFLSHQITTLGPLHLGGKLLPASFNNHLAKLDRQARKNLQTAKDIIDNSPYDGFGPGFGPQLAYAGATVSPGVGPGFGFDLKPLYPARPLAMAAWRPNDQGATNTSSGRGSGSLSDREMVTNLKEKLKRHPRISTEFRGNWDWLEQMNVHQLRAMNDLIQVPSESYGDVLSELLHTRNAQSILDLLRSMDAEAAQGLRDLIRVDRTDSATSLVRRFFRTDWMFEAPEGSPAGSPTRAMLLLKAYTHLENVYGAADALQKTTLEYKGDGGHWQVYAPNEKALWRGNVDEVIRLGILQARAEAGEGTPLTSVNREMGFQRFTDETGRTRNHRMEADGVRENEWMDEVKTTYNAAIDGPGDFSFTSMGGDSALKFKNQVRKYGQAIRDKKIAGVTYQITARSVDPEVVEFLKTHVPNVVIVRYDSVLDTVGTVVDKKISIHSLKPKMSPTEFVRAHSNDMIFIQDGKFKAFAFKDAPQSKPHSGETVEALLVESYEATGWNYIDLPSTSQAARFKYLIEKTGELMQRLEPDAGKKLEEDIFDLLSRSTDQKSPQDALSYTLKGLDNMLQKLIVEQGYGTASGSIDLPAKLDPQRNLDPNGEAKGEFQLYLKNKDYAKFRKLIPPTSPKRKKLLLKAGTILFTGRGYSSSEVKQQSNKSMGGDHLFAFDTSLNIPIQTITLPNGEMAHRVLKDIEINTSDLTITYYGENPHVDVFQEAM